MTKIEWTEATWNPIVGCTVTSAGCTNCYAMRQAHRLASNPATPHYHGTTTMSRGGPVWTGKIGIAPDNVLTAPLRRKKPTTYFANSMGDLFHPNVLDDAIDRAFAVMALCPQHTFQVLTKHPERMREYMRRRDSQGRHPAYDYAALMAMTGRYNTPEVRAADFIPLPNVWLGTSIENQSAADERIPHLLNTPAAIRFISAEPLLGNVVLDHIPIETEDEYGKFWAYLDALTGRVTIGDFADQELDSGHQLAPGLDWVIVGGESGKGARPMHPDWPRWLRDQCLAASVPFFFKQWGEFADHTERHSHCQPCKGSHDLILNGAGQVIGGGAKGYGGFCPDDWPTAGQAWMCAVGKRAAGRLLDGREWNEVPA